METTLSRTEIDALLSADLMDPFSVLGMHRLEREGRGLFVVRALLPGAREVAVVPRERPGRYVAVRVADGGVYEAVLPGVEEFMSYELEIVDPDGTTRRARDPYSFWPQVSDYGQYLFNEGTHLAVHDLLGAHVAEVDGTAGVHFAVWAPAARRVSVVGPFNRWDGRSHGLRPLGSSGIWEIFLPGVGEGDLYKYEIKTATGELLLKSDPLAFASEVPPRTASVVGRTDRFAWDDGEWMAERRRANWLERPISIYEVHAGSWRRPADGRGWLSFRELAHQLVPYVRELGFTHVQLLPVAEYPFDGSWGYQGTGYFAPTARHGGPRGFAYFVDYCHRHGLGVIIDWVPGHFPKDGHGLARFDGTALYEHLDPRQGVHPDWDTLIFNYGRSEVRSFLLSNALFWLERYHVDGLRVDAVASMLYLDYSRSHGQWVANPYGGRENLEAIDLLKKLNTEVHARHPGALMIAEESTAWPGVSRPTFAGGLGFSLKWNLGWMHDVLRYMSKDPIHRKHHHADLTFGMLYAYNENFVLPLSHDEVVHGKKSLLSKMPGDDWQKFANLRLLYCFMYGHPGKKLLFMGAELAQWSEWNHVGQLDWALLEFEAHRGIGLLLRDLNRLYCSEPVLHATDFDPAGFAWIDCLDVDNSVISFVRRQPGGGSEVVFVLNCTPVPRESYRIGVPAPGYYREVINTDAGVYGGSGLGNGGGVTADGVPWHAHAQSVALVLPPLGAIVLQRQPAPGV